jgi:hypothetical protein
MRRGRVLELEVSNDSTNSPHHAGMFPGQTNISKSLVKKSTAVFRGSVPFSRCCILSFVVAPRRLRNLIPVDLHFSKFINVSRNAVHLCSKVFLFESWPKYSPRPLRNVVISRGLDGIALGYGLDGNGSIPSCGKKYLMPYSV